MCDTDRKSGRYDLPGGADFERADLIAAEDTRNSIKLLNHFEIKTPMTSYHEYNKIEKGHKLVERLQNGEDIAVITDAGMPGISDPGFLVVRECVRNGIEVQCLPGATAFVRHWLRRDCQTRNFVSKVFLPSEEGRMTKLKSTGR